MRGLLLAGLLALVSIGARADQVWTYTGNAVSGQSLDSSPLPPNLCGCALTGTVDFAAPLVAGQGAYSVLAFSFSAGAYTFDNSNSTLEINPFLLSYQPLDTWFFAVHALTGELELFSERYDNYEATDAGVGGLYVQANHGVWSDPPAPIAAPEPKSIVLASIGLFCMLLIALKEKRKGGDAT